MWGVLSELEELKQVPNTSGFQQLNPGDNLTFVSHAWNISLDPTSGAVTARPSYSCDIQTHLHAGYLLLHRPWAHLAPQLPELEVYSCCTSGLLPGGKCTPIRPPPAAHHL